MTAKPIIAREQARGDVEAAADYYVDQVGDDVALGFINALESVYRLIATRSSAGSPFYGHALDLPGLRHRRLGRYPYLVFYVDRGDHIDVWRVLHAQRDIPARLQETRD
jgi:toxin ParE1/3/4